MSEFIAKLIAELRSGKWTQIRGRYRDDGCGRCAQGVAYEVMMQMGAEFKEETDDLAATGLSRGALTNLMCHLLAWNDADHLTFPQIADRIEAVYEPA